MTTMIGHYREFLEPHPIAWKYPCMKDDFSEAPIPEKEKIIDFILNAGFLDVGTTATAKDVFTGEDTGIRDNGRSDGVYSWGTALAYYVDRYNLMLPDEFVAHILGTRNVASKIVRINQCYMYVPHLSSVPFALIWRSRQLMSLDA